MNRLSSHPSINFLFVDTEFNVIRAVLRSCSAVLVEAGSSRIYRRRYVTKKSKLFGVIVFESDQDLDPKTVYLGYQDRWLIELVFKRYKNDEDFDKTRVQSDFSVIGSELINFISTLITCRLVKKSRESRTFK